MADITDEELEQIEKLREHVSDILTSDEDRADHNLVRWLRARNHDFDKAEHMIRENCKWRHTHHVNSILHREFGHIYHENCPYHISARDRNGRAVLEMPFGRWDVKKVVTAMGENEFFLYTTQMFERIMEKIRLYFHEDAANNPRRLLKTQLLIIANFDGFSYTQFINLKTMQGCLQIASTYEAYYPEILFRAIMINAPRSFPMFFSILKKFIDPRTADKILVYGTKREEWQPCITELIDPNQIGKDFGGVLNR